MAAGRTFFASPTSKTSKSGWIQSKRWDWEVEKRDVVVVEEEAEAEVGSEAAEGQAEICIHARAHTQSHAQSYTHTRHRLL